MITLKVNRFKEIEISILSDHGTSAGKRFKILIWEKQNKSAKRIEDLKEPIAVNMTVVDDKNKKHP